MGELVVCVVVDVLGHVGVENLEGGGKGRIAAAAGDFAVLDAAEFVVLLPEVGLECFQRGEETENRRVTGREATACVLTVSSFELTRDLRLFCRSGRGDNAIRSLDEELSSRSEASGRVVEAVKAEPEMRKHSCSPRVAGAAKNRLLVVRVGEGTPMRVFGPSNEATAEVVQVLLVSAKDPLQADAEAGLATRGFSVTRVADGASAIKSLRDRVVDLLLLDLELPDVDGIALLTAVRAARPHLPVITLTASDDEDLRVDGFARGADDCVDMPFSIPELAARMEARLRWRERSETVIRAGPLSLDLSRNRVTVGERVVALSPREGTLLATFLRHAGEVLSREALLRLVWELEFDPGSNIVDVYVAALRRKLGSQVIETIRGRGYRLRVSALASCLSTSA